LSGIMSELTGLVMVALENAAAVRDQPTLWQLCCREIC